MEGPRLDEREIGDQRAHLRDVLDAPDQVVVRGVVLVDDGRARRLRVIDQHVHLVAAQQRFAALGQRNGNAEQGRLLAVLGLAEDLGMVEHVILHAGEIVLHPRQRIVVGLQFLDQAGDRRLRDLPVKFAQLALSIAPPLRQLVDFALQSLPEAP